MKKTARNRARKALEKAPAPQGWVTTDEDEIRLRQWRAANERMDIQPLDGAAAWFGVFAIGPKTTLNPYRVEIRSLIRRENSCTCPDFKVNGLGTCKHLEAVLARLRRRGIRAFETAAQGGPPWAEVYLSRQGATPEARLWLPPKPSTPVRKFLTPFFGADGRLLGDPAAALPALLRAWEKASPAIRRDARLSAGVADWAGDLGRRSERVRAREDFLADVKAGKRTLDVVRHKLYPYQEAGMLHLAFGERALLADEMGLGKTVQAVAACELLRQLRGIERVLVVSPASLKAEWEEQIAKFTGLPSRVILGRRADRLKAYREPAFFYLTNYEQARADVADMNRLIAPDVIILDEAQRIKNWQTKTAQTIKQLASPFAFVLTGTPLENRIDEVYSIAQFLDPAIFGPLFRFNRDFYVLNEDGRPEGLKNLPELHRRLRPVMLRRRKDQVEEQLPERTVKTYFVAMDKEQRARYAEYEADAAKLIMIAQRRPLTPDGMERLQRILACMRMTCDTPHILDPKCRICPKLGELAEILEDVLSGGDAKVIVFSEWERMLHLVRDLTREMKVGFAWHTGSVPQAKRRAEINRFKQDPECRLFLSTDSGATGLNLQAANVVINLDLPWNPAKLEQRIARAWRKHQTRAVRVVNLVTEDSIEHRMLSMLAQKQQLADGVLDGRGDLENITLPSGRAAFMARLQSLMGERAPSAPPAPRAAEARQAPAPKPPPEAAFAQDLVARCGTRLAALECRTGADGRQVMMAVVDDARQLRPIAERLLGAAYAGGAMPGLEVVDRATYETIQRLIAQGVLQPAAGAKVLHGGLTTAETGRALRERRLGEARAILEQADRKRRMGMVLREGGFTAEAVAPLREAVEMALKAVSHWAGNDPKTGEAAAAFTGAAERFGSLASGEAPGESIVGEILDSGNALVTDAGHMLTQASLA